MIVLLIVTSAIFICLSVATVFFAWYFWRQHQKSIVPFTNQKDEEKKETTRTCIMQKRPKRNSISDKDFEAGKVTKQVKLPPEGDTTLNPSKPKRIKLTTFTKQKTKVAANSLREQPIQEVSEESSVEDVFCIVETSNESAPCHEHHDLKIANIAGDQKDLNSVINSVSAVIEDSYSVFTGEYSSAEEETTTYSPPTLSNVKFLSQRWMILENAEEIASQAADQSQGDNIDCDMIGGEDKTFNESSD